MTLLALCLLTVAVTAQTSKEARRWLRNSEWSQMSKAKPHKTLNVEEFYRQYHKNRRQWDALYEWLRATDLQAIPKGKHPIPGSTLVASVEDSENALLEKRNTESHRRKIDFQLVVRGTEGFALLDHKSSTVKSPYDDAKDVTRYNYVKEDTRFFDVKAGQYVVFFPTDWHIAKLRNKKKRDHQQIRVVVVKMDYKD